MTTFNPADHPRGGNPDNPGEFSAKRQGDPGNDLLGSESQARYDDAIAAASNSHLDGQYRPEIDRFHRAAAALCADKITERHPDAEAILVDVFYDEEYGRESVHMVGLRNHDGTIVGNSDLDDLDNDITPLLQDSIRMEDLGEFDPVDTAVSSTIHSDNPSDQSDMTFSIDGLRRHANRTAGQDGARDVAAIAKEFFPGSTHVLANQTGTHVSFAGIRMADGTVIRADEMDPDTHNPLDQQMNHLMADTGNQPTDAYDTTDTGTDYALDIDKLEKFGE